MRKENVMNKRIARIIYYVVFFLLSLFIPVGFFVLFRLGLLPQGIFKFALVVSAFIFNILLGSFFMDKIEGRI